MMSAFWGIQFPLARAILLQVFNGEIEGKRFSTSIPEEENRVG